MSDDTASSASTLSSTKKALIAIGLGVAVVGTFAFIAATGDSDQASEDVSVSQPPDAGESSVTEAPSTDNSAEAVTQPIDSTPEPAVTEPAVTEPAVTEPAPPPTDAPTPPATEEPSDETRPVPTIVIGQDENGDDIVVELEIAEACGTTFHEPLDDNSLSFIRWEFDAPGLAVDTPISVAGADGFSQFTKVTADQKIIIEQGISSYGDYRFPSVAWTDGDVETSIDPDGDHTVDEREGEPSRTCVS